MDLYRCIMTLLQFLYEHVSEMLFDLSKKNIENLPSDTNYQEPCENRAKESSGTIEKAERERHAKVC